MAMPISATEHDIRAAINGLIAEGRPITGWGLRRHTGCGDAARLLSVATRIQMAVRDADQPRSDAPALPGVLSTCQADAETRIVTELRDLFGRAWATAADLADRRVAGEVEAARGRIAAAEDDLADATVVVANSDELLAAMTVELSTARATADEADLKREAAEHSAHASEIRLQEVRVSLSEATGRVESIGMALGEALAQAASVEREVRIGGDQIRALCAMQANSDGLLRALNLKLEEATSMRIQAEARARDAEAELAVRLAVRTERTPRKLPRGTRSGRKAGSLTARSQANPETLRSDDAVSLAPIDPPEVPDRLSLDRDQRDAYDDGATCAFTGHSPSRRFLPGQRLAEMRPWWDAGLRDGTAAKVMSGQVALSEVKQEDESRELEPELVAGAIRRDGAVGSQIEAPA